MSCVKLCGSSVGLAPSGAAFLCFPVFGVGRLSTNRKLGLAPYRGTRRDLLSWAFYAASRSVSKEQ
jgi:hypothetical protein